MRKVSKAEIKQLEEVTIEEFGISEEALTELAGEKLAEFVRENYSRNLKIGIICGKGRNSTDGLVAARRLNTWGFEIEVYTPYEREELSDLNRKKLDSLSEELIQLDLPSANVYVDALIGYNLSGELRSPVKEACIQINDWSTETVSVDVPTGLDIEECRTVKGAINADYTVTFGALKYGMGKSSCGEIFISDVGFPVEAYEEVGMDYPDMLHDEALTRLN